MHLTPSLDKLLEEFERLTLDERVYLTFQSDDDLGVCVQYKRIESKAWSIWYALSQEASKQSCSRQHVPYVLKAFKISERVFQRELTSILLTQAAYADEFVRQITELVGEESVRNSIRETQQFMDTMTKAVAKLLHEESTTRERPTLSEVKLPASPSSGVEAAQEKASRGRLRIIRP